MVGCGCWNLCTHQTNAAALSRRAVSCPTVGPLRRFLIVCLLLSDDRNVKHISCLVAIDFCASILVALALYYCSN